MVSLSVRLFSESFFYQFDLNTGAAKIHTCTHAHIHTRVNTWVLNWPACWSQVTPPPLLWAPLLSPLLFLSYFFTLFIPLTVSCPHISRIYTPRGVAEASCRASDVHFLKHVTTHLGAEITSRDHQLGLVNLVCLCFVPYIYDAGRDCW